MSRVRTLVTEVVNDVRGHRYEPQSDAEHLQAAMDWLVRSHDVTGKTGSAAYYSLLTGWADPYPETTGYIIPTLYDYAELEGENEAATRATEMAEWLLDTQLDEGGFPAGTGADAADGPSVFNTGQIILGLTRTYRETGKERFRNAAVRAADWLVSVQQPGGYWDQFDYRGEPHSYSSRVAWALLEVSELVDNSEFHQTAVTNLEWVVDQQQPNGWFEHAGFSPDETPFLHTIAYTIRGLVEAGHRLDTDRFLDAATTTAGRLAEIQRESGILRGEYDRGWNGASYYCLTGNAQMSVIWSRLDQVQNDDRFSDQVDATVSFLKTNHETEGNTATVGGLRGSVPVWQRYMRFRYPNWAVKFFVDALQHRHT